MWKKALMLLFAICALAGAVTAEEVPAAVTPAEAPCAVTDAAQTVVASEDAPIYGWAQTAPASEGRGGPGANSYCSAQADCHNGSSVSCTGSSTCSAVDSNCPSTRGYVECDGVRHNCPVCPDPICGVYDSSYCKYKYNPRLYCCVAYWTAHGASCPNVCE